MLLALVVILLFVHDVFGRHGFIAMRQTQQEIHRLQGEVVRLNEENVQLADQIKALRTDPKLIERIARDELGLARPGEIIIRVPAPAQVDSPRP
jgi:cell division protein FtsB